MGAHYYGTHYHRQHVGDHVLDRVGVERDHANGGCPLVVLLMDFLIERWVVKEPGRVNS